VAIISILIVVIVIVSGTLYVENEKKGLAKQSADQMIIDDNVLSGTWVHEDYFSSIDGYPSESVSRGFIRNNNGTPDAAIGIELFGFSSIEDVKKLTTLTIIFQSHLKILNP
jgi:hypothetical protein